MILLIQGSLVKYESYIFWTSEFIRILHTLKTKIPNKKKKILTLVPPGGIQNKLTRESGWYSTVQLIVKVSPARNRASPPIIFGSGGTLTSEKTKSLLIPSSS